MNKTDLQLKKELDYLKDHFDEVAAKQEAEHETFLNDPARAEQLAAIQAGMRIAEELYKARKAAKLTQKELAEKLHTSQSFIARMEQGKVNMTIQTVAKYAAACGKKIALI